MDCMIQDLRYAFRTLVKSPGFTAVAVLSLGLGIAANGVIFSLINLVFLRPLPVDDPAELVYLYNEVPDAPYPYDLSYPDYTHYRDDNEVLSGLAGFKPRALNLSAGGRNERIYGEIVTGNYFDVLGVEAALGRTFLPEEDEVPGRHPVVVLSHAFWKSRFGSIPSIVGETIRLNGHQYTVVGVAPEGFTGLFIVGFSPALWVPVMMADQVSPGSGDEMIHLRDRRWLRVIGRLDEGVSVEQAQAATATIARRLEIQYPDTNKGVGIRLYLEREARPSPGTAGVLSLAMAVFMAIVGMVLLVACANVANLLLARATVRSRELVSVDPTLSGYDGARQEQFLRQLLERVKSSPGVKTASLASPLPLEVWSESVGIEVEGWESRTDEEEIAIMYSLVGPNCFETMRTSMVRGRGFNDRDDHEGPPVVVINDTMAERYWPDRDPLGRQIHLTGPMASRNPDKAIVEIIGIVSTGKYGSLGESPLPYMFFPIYQRPATNVVDLTVRTAAAPTQISETLRRELRAVDASLAVFNVKTMHEHLGRSLLGAQIAAGIVGVFGLLGLVLAAVGIYGVLSYTVSQRTKEIGIRVALETKRSQVVRLVVAQSMLITTVGMGIGLSGAFALTRVASGLLYGVKATDPSIFMTVSIVLALVALVATSVPAWRALRVDPIETLRHE